MSPSSEMSPHAGPASTESKGVLRFMTCGSVDVGKSTLIGRLIYDLGQVADDQIEALRRSARRPGASSDALDLSLLVDGLDAEREQGITIDVAYRYFATPRRKFIVADTPGHEQYTRNMATGASVSDLAVLLVDARAGLLTQTRRHFVISRLLGIRHFVLAVNKMDLVGYAPDRLESIERDLRTFANNLGAPEIVAIPIVAHTGENVALPAPQMPWYRGPRLVEHLEQVEAATASNRTGALRLPVQLVLRPEGVARSYAGTIASGAVRIGDSVAILPSGATTRVAGIAGQSGPCDTATAGEAVALTLTDELDVGRGDLVVGASDRPQIADQFQADIIWLAAEPMLPGRHYTLKTQAQSQSASISRLKHKIDADSLSPKAGGILELNDVGVCNITLSRPIPYEPYDTNRTLGSFILIDRQSKATVGAGLIRFGLRRAENLHWQTLEIDKSARARALGQKPLCIWLTGLSGAGKSTIANLVEKKLHARGLHSFLIDGDNVRHRLNRDLGFTDADRTENIRRVAEVARLMTDAGLVVIVSLISPFRAERRTARELFETDEFVEVFVDAPLAVCEERDPKGLYKKARKGQLPRFTGIDSAYEPPLDPELHVDSAQSDPEALADRILAIIMDRQGNTS